MRRRIFAAALAALLLLSACGTEGEADPTPPSEETQDQSAAPSPAAEALPFALAWDPEDTLDPLAAGTPNQTLIPLVFQGLFAVNGSFEAENALCSSYVQSEDGRSWTFTLREGVSFSDGTLLTGAHVARCLNAARGSALYGARLAAVTAVTAGEGTVTVNLSAPNGALPVLLDVPVFLEPAEGAWPLGTGPYCFDGGEGELCLRLSPEWRGSAPPLDTIPLRQVTSVSERIAAFDTGQVTLVDTDFTASGALGYSGRYESWDYPSTVMLYLGFNTQKGACKEAALRRAVSWSIDRAEAAASSLSGHADPAVLPASPKSALYDEALAKELDHTPSEGAQLLEDAGYRLNDDGLLTQRGRAVTVTLLVNRENAFRTGLADRLAGELGELGLTVTVSKLPWDDYLAALERGEFDLYLGQVKMTADFDPTALIAGGLNYGGFDGKELDGALAEYRAASGQARAAAGSALWTLLAEETPFAPLCFVRGCVLTRWGTVSGLTPTQNDPFYGMKNWKFVS